MFRFFLWLWKLLTRRRQERAAVSQEKQEIRLILQQGFSRLRPRRFVFYKLIRIVRQGHVIEDTERNGLLVVDAVEEFQTTMLPETYIVVPLDMTDLFDMDHLPETIFEDFWEWPDRSQMQQAGYYCHYMREHGVMACICHHIRNSQGSVVAMMAALYDDPHHVTDDDRDTMRLSGRQLQMLLPWLQ